MIRIGLFLLCAGWSSSALSQACCTATGSQDFAVVGRCQQAVIAVQTSAERTMGSTDRTGDYARCRGPLPTTSL